jgi:hypothetical protein
MLRVLCRTRAGDTKSLVLGRPAASHEPRHDTRRQLLVISSSAMVDQERPSGPYQEPERAGARASQAALHLAASTARDGDRREGGTLS